MLLPLLLRLCSPVWAESPWSAEAAPGGWAAVDARFVLHIREGEAVRFEANYQLATPDVRAGTVRLVGPEVLVTNVSGPVVATAYGLEATMPLDRTRLDQKLSGLYLPPSEGSGTISVLSAARTHIEIDAPGLDVEVYGAVDGWLQSSSSLNFSWHPHDDTVRAEPAALVQAEVATAFRADANALAVDSVLRWRVLRGSAGEFSFDTGGLGELEVVGPNVQSFRQSGNTVVITPKQAVNGLFSVQVTGRAAGRKGEQDVPGPTPSGAQRVDHWWLMTKSDEGELVPVQSPPSAGASELPSWARGVGEGAPLAQWHGNGGVRVFPIDAANVQGPDTVITSARYIVAAAREGRAGLRMTLRVRNERRQFLHVKPPKGWNAIVVRVGNQPVSILADGAGGLYVPLEKSIETVKGLLSFPVDIEWVGDEDIWAKKGHHTFALPSVDAPIQAAEWEVHLPRGFRGFVPVEKGGKFVFTDVREADALPEQNDELLAKRQQAEQVESALSNAVSAYKKNDFEAAQMWIDNAKTVTDSNEEVEQLQSNLDVLSGKAAPSSSSSTEVAVRRVKDLAKAKTSGLVTKQTEIEDKALDAYRSGDLDQAESLYEEAYLLANELQRTEQAESTVQTSKISVANDRLSSIREAKGKKKAEEDSWSNVGGDRNSPIDTDEEGTADGKDYGGDDYGVNNGDALLGWNTNGEPEPADTGAADGTDASQSIVFESSVLGMLQNTVGDGTFGFGGLGTIGTGEGGYGYGAGSGYGTGGGSAGQDQGAEKEVQSLEGAYADETIEAEGEIPGQAYGEISGVSAGAIAEPTTTPQPEMNKEFLQRIPAGRSFGSVVTAVPGVMRGAKGGGKAETKKYDKTKMDEGKEEDEERYSGAESVVVTAAKPVGGPIFGMSKKPADEPEKRPVEKSAAHAAPASPRAPAAAGPAPILAAPKTTMSGRVAARERDFRTEDIPPAEAPPPPPAPPASAAAAEDSYTRSPASGADLIALGYAEDSTAPTPITDADRSRLRQLGYVDDAPSAGESRRADDPESGVDPAFDGRDTVSQAAFHEQQLGPILPDPGPKRRPLERRRALEAAPSPMAFAMPLDGPAVAYTNALLPADKAPTFTVRYQELPSENL